MTKWLVVTPEFTFTEPIMDDGSGPSYDVRDVVEIEASTARDAVRDGVRLMLACRMKWVKARQVDGLCPYSGVTAEEVSDAE